MADVPEIFQVIRQFSHEQELADTTSNRKQWVSLKALREHLAERGYSREEQDRGMLAMQEAGHCRLEPFTTGVSRRPEVRAVGLMCGGEQMDMLCTTWPYVTPEKTLPVPATPGGNAGGGSGSPPPPAGEPVA